MEIHTIDDLIAIMQQHPECPDRLREALFTEQERQVPDRLRRIEEVLERLVDSHERAIMRLDRLEASHQQALERLERLEVTLQQLVQEVRELRVAVERLTRWLQRLDNEVAKSRGYIMEVRLHQRASAILRRYVRRARVLDLGMVVDDLTDAGTEIEESEKNEILALDELVSAKHPRRRSDPHCSGNILDDFP